MKTFILLFLAFLAGLMFGAAAARKNSHFSHALDHIQVHVRISGRHQLSFTVGDFPDDNGPEISYLVDRDTHGLLTITTLAPLNQPLPKLSTENQ